MADKSIQVDELKNLFHQINLINQENIKGNDQDLSLRIEKFLEQTQNLSDVKLKEVLTPEFSKLVNEIEQKFGPVITDNQSSLKKIIDSHIDQEKKEEVEQKAHVAQSPGDGQPETAQVQDVKVENNAQSQPGRIQQYMAEPAKVGLVAMALKAATNEAITAVQAGAEMAQKMKAAFENKRENVTKKEDIALDKLQAAAETAQGAMKQFMENVAGKVGQKMQKEAENHPEGMAGIIQEMSKEGNQASLYKEMNKVKRNNPEAWNQVTESIKNYSAARMNAMEDLKNAGPFYQDKVTKLDADVGQLAKNIPGGEGKNLMEELGEKVKQVVEKAIELVNQILNRQVNVGSKPSASSSPSPSL